MIKCLLKLSRQKANTCTLVQSHMDILASHFMDIGKPLIINCIVLELTLQCVFSHEVNVASVPSGYTLKPHYRTILDDEKENYVKVCSVCE